jgi:hypothetical protein
MHHTNHKIDYFKISQKYNKNIFVSPTFNTTRQRPFDFLGEGAMYSPPEPDFAFTQNINQIIFLCEKIVNFIQISPKLFLYELENHTIFLHLQIYCSSVKPDD